MALEYFRSAVADGYYSLNDFDDPMLAPLAGQEGFEALRRQVQDVLTAEREKALVMLCKDNPVPEHWQPLAETCRDASPARG